MPGPVPGPPRVAAVTTGPGTNPCLPLACGALRNRSIGGMEFLVTMTTLVPDGTTDEAVAEIRGREAARSRELAAQGHLVRLWRPPLQPGEWRTIGLFAA